MKSITVKDGQTVIDIAVQELGDAGRAGEVALLNGIGITDELIAGSTLDVPAFDIDKRNVVQLFSDSSNAPSSSETDDAVLESKEGIGYWIIGNNFKVS